MPEAADSQRAAEDSSGSPPIGQAAALMAALVVLLGVTLYSTRRRAGDSGQTTSLALQTLVGARAVYALARSSSAIRWQADLPKQERELLRDMTVVSRTRSPRAIRRLALMQHGLGHPGWRASLLLLSESRGLPDPFQAEEEMALWREVLEPHGVPAAAVPALRARIERLDPGWFSHLALESLYRNAGMASRAEAESRAAIRSYAAIVLLSGVGLLVGLIGFGLGIALLIVYIRQRRSPAARLPVWLRPVQVEPLTRDQAGALYTVFISYLATYAVIQVGILGIAWPLLGANGIRLSPTSASLLSIALLAAWLAVPYAFFRRLSRKTGLTVRQIGFTSPAPVVDVIYGIAGYAVALPVLGIVSVVSNRLFQGIDSPLNPALTQFVASRSALVSFLLFAQAAVIAPVVEETMFRGVFYRSLSGRLGARGAVVVASGVFAVLHPQLPVGFLGIFALGVVFNWLAVMRSSLLPSITAHAINNAVIFTLLMIVLGS